MIRTSAFVLLTVSLGIAWARADDSLVLQAKYVKTADVAQILKTAGAQMRAGVEITVDGQQITLRGGDEELRKKLAGIATEVDVPYSCGHARFIKLQHASVEKAAEFLNKALATASEPEPGAEDVPIQVVPATRTNEIFVMGRPQDIRLVESLARAIDTDPPPVFK